MPTQWSEAEQVPLGCIAPPYNAFLTTVALHERQRRKTDRQFVIRTDNHRVL